jgi:hypothetical protein
MADEHEIENYPDPARIVEANIRGKKYVEFIHHAIDEMRNRGMTEEEVLRTLSSPDDVRDDLRTPGRKVAFKNFGALNTAKVVFVEKGDRFRVITVMWKKRRLSGR